MGFELLTMDEAAKQARVSRRYLNQRIADGTGPARIFMGRRPLVRSDAFQAWLEGLAKQPAVKQPTAKEAVAA